MIDIVKYAFYHMLITFKRSIPDLLTVDTFLWIYGTLNSTAYLYYNGWFDYLLVLLPRGKLHYMGLVSPNKFHFNVPRPFTSKFQRSLHFQKLIWLPVNSIACVYFFAPIFQCNVGL